MSETIADLERRFYEKRLNPGPGPDPDPPGDPVLGDLLVTSIESADTEYTQTLLLDKAVPAGDTLIIVTGKTLTSAQEAGFVGVTGVSGTWEQVANSVRLSTVNVTILACKLTEDVSFGTEITVENISSANRRVAVCFSVKNLGDLADTSGAANGTIGESVSSNGNSNTPTSLLPNATPKFVVFAHSVAGSATVVGTGVGLNTLAEIKTSAGSADRGVWVGTSININTASNTLSASQSWAACMVGFDGVQ